MIPSTLAAEVIDALTDFLATGFGPANPVLATVMDDFLAQTDNLVKGPYLSIDLPFQHAPEGGEPFPETPLGFTPYRHQRTAFERLKPGQSTVVATGTGSGKTECFLYPVLDHCRAQAGSPGVKAILVYPMNALASDQARRIARIVHRTPSLRGKVTAGLYVGESGASPQKRMTADNLVENREVLRERPPDILLTNYKMLDLLLTRPVDSRLWRHNATGTLRYLVVDELHTFDGAQGTDLACLIRRLRARLQATDELTCVGTSATIGGEEDREAIVRYVSGIFHQPFSPDSIVGEVRQGIDEFLRDAIIDSYLVSLPDLAERVNPSRYASFDEFVRAQHTVFFGDAPNGKFDALEWRLKLGGRLREHASFVNLLRVLDGSKPVPVATVLDRLQRSLPVASAQTQVAANLLNALCALISVARQREDGGRDAPVRPLLNVKLHLWVRELRRMVCSLHEDDGPTHRVRYADDLKPDEDSVHLPLIQCRECHATGWGCFKPAADNRIGQDLRVFYNRFFLRDVDVNYLFPMSPSEEPPQAVKGQVAHVCGRCGHLAARKADGCPGCGRTPLTRVFRPNAVVTKRSGKRRRPQLSRDCPYCGAREALIILGARASSLLSTALAQIFSSRHNNDRKVIAFSDNVQDAAHRGSFFAARTWRNSIRAAIAQVAAEHEGISLANLPDQVVARWGDSTANPGAFNPERFISEFIAPDRVWLRDFEALKKDGALPTGSNLLSMVQHRMRWDTLGELTFGTAIGRTLERTRTAAVGFNSDALRKASETALVRIRENFGELRTVDEACIRSLLLGILRRMKDRGAVESPMFANYLRSGGNPFAIRDHALQDFGPRSALPVFPAPVAQRNGVEALAAQPKSWYQVWAEKVLTPLNVLAATRNSGDVLYMAMDALTEAGLVCVLPAGRTKVWALRPEHLFVTTQTAIMRCRHSRRSLVVPAREAALWQGVPCLDLATHECYDRHDAGSQTWAGRLYRDADIRRIVSAEHTALVPREERDRLQERFAAADAKPWEPNLLSATPTLELGVDIGELSTVVMCSVPPAPVNYVQRTGRAGRRDGNALTLTVATGRPHDLYYYAEPLEMLGSRVDPPGIFLNAPAVLERQLTAFCLDCWVAGGVDENAVPRRIRPVLDNVEKSNTNGFPYPFFNFIAENDDDLLNRFLDAFKTRPGVAYDLDDASREYLANFLQGNDPEDSLRLRILKRIMEVAQDRQSLRNDVETLGRRIRTLGAADEATEASIKNLSAERTALQRLLRTMNGRDTFGFLTDEGLLPNYAFPEPGVTLNSVIFQRRQGETGELEDDAVVFEYARPAAAALGEFAPENVFYAGGRRVEIRRIDTRVSPIERWRLCPSCSYCENVDAGDRHGACPRCGDPLWGDAGQVREMLRLRLVHAATQDRVSRIMDERDDREPLFYTRQMVADFDPASVSRAFASADSGRPFGFEYVPSATFREINFGRLDELESPTAFAGEEMPRKGFSLCRRCGGVQLADGEVQHTATCNAGGDKAIVDCLYLYRDFSSEAVRMLIPAAGTTDTEQRTASFIAALELGLRRQFAGAVDHLRVMTCRFPASESGADFNFLMLYDTVPGGTGYLKQMMNDPGNVMNIFRIARDAISQCECNADPLKDGCYRCVYAYRRSYDMASTSRNTALDVLNAILDEAENLREVQGLRSINVNPLLESELEARFVEALGRFEIDGKPVRVRQDIVGGKPGFILTTAGLTYFMEAQVDLGESDGIAIGSRPDFVIRPVRPSPSQPPIAVFMDGFEFHRKKTGEDSAKRMALVRAGYLVWSLTWHDLEVVLGTGDDATNLLGDNDGRMTQLQRTLDARWDSGSIRSRLAEPSLKLLVRYLQQPDTQAWKCAIFTDLLRLFHPDNMRSADLMGQFTKATKQLPASLKDTLAGLPAETAFAGRGAWRNTPPEFAQLFVALPLDAVETPEPNELIVALHLDDTGQSAEREENSLSGEHRPYRREWNGVLRLYNLLQFLPNAWWTTALGVERHMYPEFTVPDPPPEAPDSPAWSEAMSLAVPELHSMMRALSAQRVPAPEVGFEMTDASGEVVAEAELAWEAKRIAVLLPGQDKRSFAEAGWIVFLPDAPDLAAALTE